MAGTLLSLVQEVSERVGFTAPTAAFSSSDAAVARLVRLSNVVGRHMVKEGGLYGSFTGLQRLHSFSTVDGTAEYALPSDFDRMVPWTAWNRSNTESLFGAISAQEWEEIKSGVAGSDSFHQRFRIVRSTTSTSRVVTIDPTPSSAQTLVYWYVSSNWCQSSGGTAQSEWAADTDTFLLDRDLMASGLIYRWKESIGDDFSVAYNEHREIVDRELAQQRPARALSLVPVRHRILAANTPQTGF